MKTLKKNTTVMSRRRQYNAHLDQAEKTWAPFEASENPDWLVGAD